jgi:hypothetical protein
VLVILGGLEARARFGYQGTLDALEAENAKLGRLSTIRDSIKLWPSEEKMDVHGRPILLLKWFSLLNDYRIALLIDSLEEPDPSVMTFQTAGEENSVIAKIGTTPPEPSEPLTGPEGGPPPGMMSGGPGGRAGRRRAGRCRWSWWSRWSGRWRTATPLVRGSRRERRRSTH